MQLPQQSAHAPAAAKPARWTLQKPHCCLHPLTSAAARSPAATAALVLLVLLLLMLQV
jgi:hypothetical protein